VPTDFPYEDDLLRRVPVPFFHQKPDHAVALHPAGGESELASRAVIAVPQISGVVDSIGFVLDADDKGVPAQRLARLAAGIASRSRAPGFELPSSLGTIQAGPPRCGVFVMPDNINSGTLEELLLDCARINYGGLLAQTSSYVQTIDRNRLSVTDLTEIDAPAGRRKAKIGAIGAVLKPGKAIQISLADNRWLEGVAVELPRIAAFRDFLRDLLKEPDGFRASAVAASS
jgi:hypothetical protein